MFILFDILNQILFIQRPLFIISHVIKTNNHLNNVYISHNNKLVALIYKDFIEIWVNQKKDSILIQKLKNIKITTTKIYQTQVSHDLKHIAILDIKNTIILITIEQKFIKIQFLRNYNIIYIKRLFFHYLLMFIKKKKMLSFIRLLITILDNKHILYWYQIKYKNNLYTHKNSDIKYNPKIKWTVRKKYYLLIKEKYITDISLNIEKSILLIIYEKNIIFIFSIVNLKLFSKLLFRNQYFFNSKTKKNIIFLLNSLTNDFLIINIYSKNLKFVFTNEKNSISSYSISNNCLYIIIAFQKSFIRLGKLKNLQLLIILLNISLIINHLFFLNNLYYFVFSSGFKTIQIFSFLTFKLYKIFYLPENSYFNIITVDKNDQYLIAVWDINKILIWNIKTNLLIKTFAIHYSKITIITIINNESEIATGSLDKAIKIFNFSTKKNLITTLKHENHIIDIEYEVFNNRILSLTDNNFLYVWNGLGWKLNKIINLKLLIQKFNLYFIKYFNYKNELILKFYYVKNLLILFSVFKILILIFPSARSKNARNDIFIYNLLKLNKKTIATQSTNLKKIIYSYHNITEKISILKNHNKVFISQQISSELHLFKLFFVSNLKNSKSMKYLNYQLIQNLKIIRKHLHKYNIFLISEILLLCDIDQLKIIFGKLNYLEIYLLFFILIFDVLILLKFKYKYVFLLKQFIETILNLIFKKNYYLKNLNASFISLRKFYYRKYSRIINSLLSFFYL